MNIWDIIEKTIEQFPQKTGLIDDDRSYTYSELGGRIKSLGGFFYENGISPGDRISILDYNSIQFYEVYFAAAGAGAIFNPINYRLSATEILYILKDAGSKILICNQQFIPKIQHLPLKDTSIERIIIVGGSYTTIQKIPVFTYTDIITNRNGISPERYSSDSPVHLYYTSGTTGRPKGVILTQENVVSHAEAAAEELNISESDHWGHIAPMFHLADAWAVFAVTLVGGCHVMLPGFEANQALEIIHRHQVTISNLIPTMLTLMVKSDKINDYDYSSLRVILSGGAPIAPEVVKMIMRVFRCDYIQTYGMTETSPYLTLSILNEKLRSLPIGEQLKFKAKTGRPFKTVDLKVVRENREEVEPNDEEIGEIWVKGVSITPGYWNSPEETESAFDDGWLKTGDLAVIDSEGYVNIVDRKKDMIIRGGENVYSIEVENVLYEHPSILEAAVFGIPDYKWGEVVCAAIVPIKGKKIDTEELRKFCRQKIAGFKIPEKVFFLNGLPKTGSGKISKNALKERFRY